MRSFVASRPARLVVAGFLLIGVLIAPQAAQAAGTGSISGVVTDEITGAPIQFVQVRAYDSTESLVGETLTAPDGSWTIGGLGTDGFTVRFYSYDHVIEWWDAANRAGATPVAVVDGFVTSGIDATLQRLGTVRGTVTEDGTGTPIEGAQVRLKPTSGGTYATITTDVTGTFEFMSVPLESYRIEVRSDMHADEWWDGSTNRNGATIIDVSENSLLASFDIGLAPYGSISGTVTDEQTLSPFTDVEVVVYTADWEYGGSASPAFDGSYVLDALAPGDYRVLFSPYSGEYTAEWWDDQPSESQADLVTVVSGADTSGIDASMTQTGSISGTVIEEGTAAQLSDVRVRIETTTGQYVREVWTDFDGTFVVDSLAPGSYHVKFEDDYQYAHEWWDDQPDAASATPILVSAGMTTSGVDAELTLKGSISGTVTDEATGLPIEGVQVEVFNAVTGYTTNSATTQADGTYTIEYVDPGEVVLRLLSPRREYLPEWWEDQPGTPMVAPFMCCDVLDETGKAATPLTAVNGVALTGIDAQLTRAGSISGTITDSVTGSPIPWVGVSAYSLATGEFVPWTFGTTDASGAYEVPGLDSGDYQLVFFDRFGATYSTEWFDDATSRAAASVVSVILGEDTPGIDADLGPRGGFSGMITDAATSAPLPWIEIEVYDLDEQLVGQYQSQFDGTFQVDGLSAGPFRVQFLDRNDRVYASQWWGGALSFSSADDVIVVGGVVTPGFDVGLETGGTITGTITSDVSGSPLGFVQVSAYSVVAGDFLPLGARSDGAGAYEFTGLPTGDYLLSFLPNPYQYISEWWNDQPTIDDAVPVSVTVGATTAGIDAALSQPGSISGHATTAATQPDWGLRVRALDLDGEIVDLDPDPSPWRIAPAETSVDGSGFYRLEGLPPGSYLLEFQDLYTDRPSGEHFAFELYDDALSVAEATPVVVVSGSETANVDIQLDAGASITGTVTDQLGGAPLGSVGVSAYSVALGRFLDRGASTDAAGAYELRGLAPGDYLLEFKTLGVSLNEWFDNEQLMEAATAVTVTIGATVSGVDAQLSRGGAISGTVTDGGGLPVGGIEVGLFEGGSLVATVVTESDGTFDATLLLPGTYQVRFSDPGGIYGDVWWDGQSDQGAADDVVVTAGVTTAGKNAQLVSDVTPPVVSGPAGVGAVADVPAGSPTGAAVTFTVTALDDADGAVPVSCSAVSGSVFPIGTTLVSCSATDAAGNTGFASFNVTVSAPASPVTVQSPPPTPQAPLATSVTSVQEGTVTITESTTPPTGYSILGEQTKISAPAATASEPIVLVFELDPSAVPGGVTAGDIDVFRNGLVVLDCVDPLERPIDPDPCVSSRVDLPGGGIEIEVLTSAASEWALGIPDDSDGDGQIDEFENACGSDPTSAETSSDLDGDGIPDCVDPITELGAVTDQLIEGLEPIDDKRVAKALEDLEDARQLLESGALNDAKDAAKVFKAYQKAAKELEKAIKDALKRGDAMTADALESELLDLVHAAGLVADEAIGRAIRRNGDAKDIDKALKERDKALEETASYDWDKAVDRYGKAVDHAIDALG